MVMKPSEVNEEISRFYCEHLPKFMDMRGFSVIGGAAREAQDLLTRNKFDKIVFIGSTQVARHIAANPTVIRRRVQNTRINPSHISLNYPGSSA